MRAGFNLAARIRGVAPDCLATAMLGEIAMTDANGCANGATRRLRSRRWFDDPHDPGITALYIERYMNYGITREELQGGKPIIGIAQIGNDLSPCNRRRSRGGPRRGPRHPAPARPGRSGLRGGPCRAPAPS